MGMKLDGPSREKMIFFFLGYTELEEKQRKFCYFRFVLFYVFGKWYCSLKRYGALDKEAVVERGEGWRLVSCMWLHAGVIHLLANMVSLLFIGIRLEQEFGFCKYFGTHIQLVWNDFLTVWEHFFKNLETYSKHTHNLLCIDLLFLSIHLPPSHICNSMTQKKKNIETLSVFLAWVCFVLS